MIFEEIIGLLGTKTPIDCVSCSDKYDIFDIAFLDGAVTDFNTHTLYFGHIAQLREINPPQWILAAGDERPDIPGNGAFVDANSLFTVFNYAKDIILGRPEDSITQLANLETRAHNLKELLDLAAARLNNSIIALDVNFKVLAYSAVFPIKDKLWSDILARGYCTYAFTSAVSKLAGFADAPNTDDANVITCYASPLRKLYCKIYKAGRHLGYIIMPELESAISPLHFKFLPVVSRAAANAILREPGFSASEDSFCESLLYDLMIGAKPEDVRGRIAAAGVRFPEKTCALCVRHSRYLGQSHMRSHVKDQLLKILPGTHVALYEKCLAALVPLKEPTLSLINLDKLAAFAKEAFVQIGISNSFSGVEQFEKYYQQAIAALELCRYPQEEALVCHYEKYSFYDLLTNIDKPRLGAYCHPALTRLNQYDQQKGSDLYRTLRVYLDQSCNLKRTAEALYIHRNSLSYRLERIAEVAAVNLDDPEMRFLLSASYRVDSFVSGGAI